MLLQRAAFSRQLVVRPTNALSTKTSSNKVATSSRRTQNSGKKTTSNKKNVKGADDSSERSPLGLQYLASSAAAAVAGAGFTLAPHQVIEALGGQQVLNFTETSAQVYGAYWILVAAAAYRLAEAADSGRLDSPTYTRLNLFLSLFLGASATSLLAGISSGDLGAAPAGAAAAALLAAAATTFVPGWRAGSGDSDGSSLAGAAAGFGDGLKQSFKAGRGLVGAFYSLSFWEALILGLALLFGPILPTVAVQDVSGTSAVIKNLVGDGTLLYAGIVWLLLDAADRGRLGASTFRALNAAAGAVSVAVAAICVAGQAGGVATNLTNQAVVIVSCGLTASVFLGLGAKPPSDE